VLQGERPMAADNMSLGRFRLDGIPSAPRGMPQVEVTFDIDANGILNVAARDKATGKEQKVTITASTNLNKSEIERMVNDARQHESDDHRRRELADVRNSAESLIYQTEKVLRDLGERVSSGDRQNIETRINGLREAVKADDTSAIRRQHDELQNAFHALSQQLNAQQAQSASQSGASDSGGNGHNGGTKTGEVVEGEFREA
jgi:molecular chaperone DnaK